MSQVVFPTGVGMNRLKLGFEARQDSVPHRRGDEPYVGKGYDSKWCVPHRRGDEPIYTLSSTTQSMCSPQAWG